MLIKIDQETPREPMPKRESYRIRCVSGELAGMWLWTMTVSKDGMPIQVTDWSDVLQHTGLFDFHPHFVPEEVAALIAPSRELARGYVRVLIQQGYDCEIASD